MSDKERIQPAIRFICLYLVFLLPNAVNGDRPSNDEMLAMIEVSNRQDFATLPPGERYKIEDSRAFAKLLHGVYAKTGSMRSAMGVLINFPSCEKDDAEFLKRKIEEDWVAVMQFPPSEPSSDGTDNASGCLFVLDRVKKAMLFGASAIIILTMNPNILQELDVVLLLKTPVVIIDDLGNITDLLDALKSVLKLTVRIAHGSSVLHDTQTFTIWSACWRARPGSGVVCMSDSRLSKVNSSWFWSYFFPALTVLMMLLLIKCRGLLYEQGDDWDDKSIGVAAWQQLSCLKIKRYRLAIHKHDDSERDTCAICLDLFYQRQKIRILPCNHKFHTRCVDPWLVRRPLCPLCKTNVLELKRFGNIIQNSGL